MKLHTCSSILAGTDDRLIEVMVDRAAPSIGGIWIRYRIGPDHPMTIWDEHGQSRLLHPDERDRMRHAAIDAARHALVQR